MATRPKNLDTSQLAKRIVDEAVGEEAKIPPPPNKDANAVRAGALGGKKGGARRAAVLDEEARREIARKAALSRWKPTQG